MKGKTLKVILIDATNRKVSIEVIPAGLDGMYKAIGCEMVEVATTLDNGDTLWVDEEALLKPCEHFFTFEGAHQPFAGNGLFTGCDVNTGESTDVITCITEISKKIKFHDRAGALRAAKEMGA